jgi:hypothetical protein
MEVVAVVAVVFGGICSDSPLAKKSDRLGVCGEVSNRLSSFAALASRLVRSGEGCSLAAVAAASEMERLLEGVPIYVSMALSRLESLVDHLLSSLSPLMVGSLCRGVHGRSACCLIVVVVVALLLSQQPYEFRLAVLIQPRKAILMMMKHRAKSRFEVRPLLSTTYPTPHHHPGLYPTASSPRPALLQETIIKTCYSRQDLVSKT